MKFKPDWPEAQARFAAMWNGEAIDRPCLAVAVANSGQTFAKPGEVFDKQPDRPGAPPSAEARGLDPGWGGADALDRIQNTWWGGEAIPSHLLLAGWLASLGGRPHFDHRTIWFEPFAVDFDQPHPFHHNPADPWYQRFEKVYFALAAAAGRDDFYVGAPAILPAHDLLSMHLGTENFLLALIDHPEWMRQAIEDGARELLAVRRELGRRLAAQHEFWYGNAGWMPFGPPVPYLGTQSDVSCMLSPDLFEQFVLPELELVGREYGAACYHLDGSDALQHLPRLLSLPYIRVIQYVPRPTEPPNGMAHLKMYRQIQAAGRIVHVQVPKDQIEPLCRALDPRLLLLEASWTCATIDEARQLLEAAKRWTSAGYAGQ